MEKVTEYLPNLPYLPFFLTAFLYILAYRTIDKKVSQGAWTQKAFLPLIVVGIIAILVLVYVLFLK